MNTLKGKMNTITKDGMELDRETVEKIRHADGEPVEIQLLATTPAGDMWFLTAEAWDTGDGVCMMMKGERPQGIRKGDLSRRRRDSVS